MKGLLKKGLLCGLVLIMAFGTTACNVTNNHKHEYSWYLVKSPTCSKTGVMEGICECGEKTYNDLQATGHNFINGTCDNCGKKEDDLLGKVEPNQVVGLSLSGIYEKYKKYGDISFEEFKSNINENAITNVRIDALGVLHCVFLNKFGQSADIILPSMKVDFELSEMSNLKNILKIGVEDNILVCTLVDGTVIEIGTVEESNIPNKKCVRSIFINKENLLGVVFSNDTVKAIGRIADLGTAINGVELFYKKIDNKQEYKVIDLANKEITKIEIPATHCGLPVTQIGAGAFADVNQITEVVLGENIKGISNHAFSNCTELTTVKLNSGLTQIGANAFYLCGKLQRMIIPSTVEICGNYAFDRTNCTIYVDIETKPIGWSQFWNGDNNRIYWKGEWELIGGVPTPKN